MADQKRVFGDNQDLSQNTGNYLFDSSIDTGAAGTPVLGGPLIHDFGRGRQHWIVFTVDEAFTSGGSATVQLQSVEADNGALTSNLQVLRETRALDYAVLTLGVIVAVSLTPMSKRYLGARCVIGGATTTAGTMTAFLAENFPSNAQHAVY